MPVNSKRKGSAGERELANILRKYGYEARRGQQFCGGGDSPDVVGVPGWHIEVKRVQGMAIGSKLWIAACSQAESESRDGERWVVVWRVNFGRWMATFEMSPLLVTVELVEWIGYAKGTT